MIPSDAEEQLKWQLTWDRLSLSPRILHRFYKVFQKIDLDQSGEVSLSEFLVYFGLDRTRFAKKTFSILDEDRSGEIDFREFVVSLWNYCSFNKTALIMFAFDLYDLDGSGTIELDEAHTVLRDLYGSGDKGMAGHAQRVLAKVTHDTSHSPIPSNWHTT